MSKRKLNKQEKSKYLKTRNLDNPKKNEFNIFIALFHRYFFYK